MAMGGVGEWIRGLYTLGGLMAEAGVYNDEVEHRHDVMLPEELGSVELPILGNSVFPLIVEVAEVFGTLLLIGWVGNRVTTQLIPCVAGCLQYKSFL